MSYEISVAENRKYIMVRINEPMTRELALKIGQEATIQGTEHDLKRYLYDVREAPNVESTLSNYQFAYKDMEDAKLDKSARVALLVKPGDASHDFIETVSKNAGYNVRLFTDEGAAIAWLE